MGRLPPSLVVFVAALLAGCSAFQSVRYHTELQSVERSKQAERRYGDYTLNARQTDAGTRTVYEDGLLRATWFFENTWMRLEMESRTRYTLRVRLDKGTFVTPSGRRDRVLRGDMSYLERNDEVPPLIVPSSEPIVESKAPASVFLLPRGQVEFTKRAGSKRGYGSTEELLQPTGGGADSTAVQANIGKRFSVTLPIETRDAINNYTFVFEVTGAKIPRGDGKDQILGTYPSEEE